jgi:hypothetical protein
MTLHLVRRGAAPITAPGDAIVDLDTLARVDRGKPEPLSHDDLVELIVHARRVITW